MTHPTPESALEALKTLEASAASYPDIDAAWAAHNTLRAFIQSHAAPHQIDVDELANEIRRIDGNHDMGAGALAEALMPFLFRAAPVPGGPVIITDDMVSDALRAYMNTARVQPTPSYEGCMKAALEVALSASPRPAEGWGPIETAPKDGTKILVHWREVARVGEPSEDFQALAWWDCDEFEITGADEDGNPIRRGGWTDGQVASWAYEEVRELHPDKWQSLPPPPSVNSDNQAGVVNV